MPRASLEDLRRADRVLVYGVTGAGKSTAAGLLGQALDLPVHLVDEEIGWLPGWVERPVEEQRRIAAEIAAEQRWLLDSAYGKWLDLVLGRAQVMVAIDYPRRLSLARLLRRTARRWATQETTCNGNTERLAQIVSRESIIVWHFRSYRRKTDLVRAWEAQADGIPVLRLTHPRQLRALLDGLGG